MQEAVTSRLKELFAAQELPDMLVDQALAEKDPYVLFHNYSEMRSERFQEDFEESFRTAINNYLQGAGVQETESIQSAMEVVAKEAGAICERAVYPGFVTQYQEVAKEMRRNLAIVSAAAFVLAAACVAALLSLYHYKHRAVRYFAYSAIGATLFNIAGLLYLKQSTALTVAGVEPEYYRQFLEEFQSQGLSSWYMVSGAGVCISVLLLLLMKRLKHTIK